MTTWWIHSNLHNYLKKPMFAAIGKKTNYLQMLTLPLRPRIPQLKVNTVHEGYTEWYTILPISEL
jgi:hypothetical protein